MTSPAVSEGCQGRQALTEQICHINQYICSTCLIVEQNILKIFRNK